ncbi:MAG: hypothetical protein HQL54_08155 [Magnetococcales bacterium]|nr:hypothetical protein [Magnetococcales bacterium]
MGRKFKIDGKKYNLKKLTTKELESLFELQRELERKRLEVRFGTTLVKAAAREKALVSRLAELEALLGKLSAGEDINTIRIK